MSLLNWLKGSTNEHFVIARFDAYQDGTLAKTETAVYEQHLATCQECRAWVQRQESLAAQVRMEMAPTAFLAPAAAARIQQNLYSSMRRAMIMNSIRSSAATVGALVVLALVVGVFILWQAGIGSGLQAPILGQGSAGQGELIIDQAALDKGLLKAIAADDLAGLASLLEASANPNAQSSPGRPVLFLAAIGGKEDAVRLLIDHGADVHAETVDGAILIKAAFEGHRQIVEMLLDAGADVNSTGRAWTPDDTALYAAVFNGHRDIVELLIERGADVNQSDSIGETPLIPAAAFTRQDNRQEIVTLLLENGADIDHQSDTGWTALHAAAYGGWGSPEGDLETARILIEHGAALDLKNEDGQTPRDLAPPGELAEMLREAMAKE